MFHPVFFCLCFWRLIGVFGVEVKSVSVMEGDSVTLNTNLTEIQTNDLIEWRFGPKKSLIAQLIRESSIIFNYVPDERFRDRLKPDRHGSLTITNTRTEHAGLYEVNILSSIREITYRFNITVYGATTSDPQTPSDHHVPYSQVLVISASAAEFMLIVAVIGMFCICRKCRDADLTHDQTDATLYKHIGQIAESEVTEVTYTCFITEQ